MRPPRTVFGMPAYNRPDKLAQTLESLLMQTCGDFALVIVDDKPTPDVQAIVQAYASRDQRIHYEPNRERLGMIGNWRKAFARARELFPESEYFAWVSDHDAWHPRWLDVLSRALDDHPDAVLAYPQMERVFPTWRRSITRRFETAGAAEPIARLRSAFTPNAGITAGNAIYGLFRARALERAGVFRAVLAPDRQLLMEVSLYGPFIHVPEILWYREVAGMFSYARQRRMFFPGRSPLHTYLPANVQHTGVLLWDLAIVGRGRPEIGRLAGTRYALTYLWLSTKREMARRDGRWGQTLDALGIGPWLRGRRSAPREA